MIRPAQPRRDFSVLRGFSLTEVVLAMGVISFVLVALIGLLAGGLQTDREAKEDVQAAHLASAIIAQRTAAPLKVDPSFPLPPLNGPVGPGTVYLTVNGTTATTPDDRYYRLDYRLTRDSTDRLATIWLSFITPWQAAPPELPTGASGGAVLDTRYESISFLPVPAP